MSIVVTGDRPTGKLHLGHYAGSLQTRLMLQNSGNLKVIIIIADTQVLNNSIHKANDVKNNIIEIMKDYISLGINPDITTIFLQSQIPELFELTTYLSNLVSINEILRIPTIKIENDMYNSNLNMGFLNYPISQTADIALFGAEYVPVGVDQLPIIHFANDLIQKFNHSFNTAYLKTVNPLLSKTPKLNGIDGRNKMSKSLNNAIFLSDDEKTIKEKVFQMYTDPNHLKISDPGKIEGNVVFECLDVFHTNKNELNNLKEQYQKGGLGDTHLKNILFNDINDFLSPTREIREKLNNDYIIDILNTGTSKIKILAEESIQNIKSLIFK